jgi:hypothetical protein
MVKDDRVMDITEKLRKRSKLDSNCHCSYSDSSVGDQCNIGSTESENVKLDKITIKWYWYCIGIVIALLTAGFYTAERLSTYETKEATRQDRIEHIKVHEKTDSHIDDIREDLVDVKIEQGIQSERSKLSDKRLELIDEMVTRLLSRTDTNFEGPMDNEYRVRKLRESVQIQELRMEQLEKELHDKRR